MSAWRDRPRHKVDHSMSGRLRRSTEAPWEQDPYLSGTGGGPGCDDCHDPRGDHGWDDSHDEGGEVLV